jgi:hypothetical protein
VGGVALHRLDQVRDEVVPPLELHVDAAPGLVDLVARLDERVVGEHEPERQDGQHRQQDVEAGHGVCIG